MGVQSVVLEYHCDLTILRCYVVYKAVTDKEFTLSDLFKTSDHTKCGGLTATGRTYQYQKFFIFNFEVEVGNSGYAAGILLVNVSER